MSTRVLSSRSSWLAEFWQYRELFLFLVWRDLKVRYKQSLLGAAWAIIQPFFTMVVFTLFFGKLAKMPSDGIPYPIFTYSALLPWTYISTALSFAGNSLISNTNLVTKVYFPRVAIPASPVLAGLVDFAIAFLVLLGMMAYYGITPAPTLLLWPLLLIPLVLLTLGAGMLLAALNVKYRDIKYATPFFIQIWLFLTPVIYPTSIIPEKFRFLVGLNPLSGIIEAFRTTLLPDKMVDWRLFAISSGVACLIFLLSALYFRKTERTFADII